MSSSQQVRVQCCSGGNTNNLIHSESIQWTNIRNNTADCQNSKTLKQLCIQDNTCFLRCCRSGLSQGFYKAVILSCTASKNLIYNNFFSKASYDKKKVAFTLAEVLITLGIIGIVAAMTLPTLITDYQKKATVNQLKVAYSILSQAIVRAQTDYGDMSEWEFDSGMNMHPEEGESVEVNESLKNFAHKYFFPYIKVIADCGTNNDMYCNYPISLGSGLSTEQPSINDYRFIINNSMVVRLIYDNNTETYGNGIFMWVDINGKQKPNRYGRDVFCFYLKRSMGALYPFGRGETRENMLNGMRGCGKAGTWHTGQWCAGLIEYDGWEIKDDYPW